MTLQEFIDTTGITLTSEWAARNPHMEGSEKMDNYKVKLRARVSAMDGLVQKTRTMRLYFSKGVGHNGAEPELAEVLECLALDAAGIENSRDFDDWCNEYGYDVDSRRAEKIYSQCRKQAERLKRFLGDGHYETLLWEVER